MSSADQVFFHRNGHTINIINWRNSALLCQKNNTFALRRKTFWTILKLWNLWGFFVFIFAYFDFETCYRTLCKLLSTRISRTEWRDMMFEYSFAGGSDCPTLAWKIQNFCFNMNMILLDMFTFFLYVFPTPPISFLFFLFLTCICFPPLLSTLSTCP